MRTRILRFMLPVVLAATGVGTFAIASPAQAALPTCNTTLQYPKDNLYARFPQSSSGGFSCLLGKGNVGSGVRALQMALKQCYVRGLVVDGIFGDKTAGALKTAQNSAGITADGVYGLQSATHIRFPWYNSDTDRFVRCAPFS